MSLCLRTSSCSTRWEERGENKDRVYILAEPAWQETWYNLESMGLVFALFILASPCFCGTWSAAWMILSEDWSLGRHKQSQMDKRQWKKSIIPYKGALHPAQLSVSARAATAQETPSCHSWYRPLLQKHHFTALCTIREALWLLPLLGNFPLQSKKLDSLYNFPGEDGLL